MKARWQAVLDRMSFRHIDPTCFPVFEIVGAEDSPRLRVAVRQARDTRDQEQRFERLNISEVRLHCFPGERLAAQWLAAAWAGYLCHEGLELVSFDGECPLDPHRAPFAYDHGLRIGLPVDLTLDSLRASLEVVMAPEAASALMEAH